MRLLLDTDVLLWLQTTPDRVEPHLGLIVDPRNERLVSAASSWEIAIKHARGRLVLPEPPPHYVPEAIRAIRGTPVAVEHGHALAVAELPELHRDPFDRLLVAQARALDAVLLTGDAFLARYPVRTLVTGTDA